MALNIDVTINSKSIRDKFKRDKAGTFMAETCARYMNPYVPMVTGALAQTYTTESWKVTYEAPYAHKQFEGNFEHSKEQHHLATSHWDKATSNAKGKQIAKEMTDYFRRLG